MGVRTPFDDETVTMRAGSRLDEMLDRLPASLAALLRIEISRELLENSTVGCAISTPGPTSAILSGALVGEGVVTLLDPHGRHDIPLATLLIGAVRAQASEVESIRFAVDGGFGVATGVTAGSGPVVALARRDPAGRILVAMTGVAPAPVLVRDPADLNRPGWGPGDRELVVGVHRRAIEAIGSVAPGPAPVSAPGESSGPETLAVIELEPAPPLAVVGTRREVGADASGPGAVGRVARSWVVPILGPPSATVDPSSLTGFGPEILDIVLLGEPDRSMNPTILGGVVAESLESGGRAATAVALRVGHPDEPIATVEIMTLAGDPDDEVGGDPGSVSETSLRIDDISTVAGESPEVTADLDEAGRLVVRTAVTDPFELRRGLATRLGIGAARIRVVALAGEAPPTNAMGELVARAALQTGRAVIGRVPVLLRSGARAVTVRSGVHPDGSVGFLQATTVSAGEPTFDQRTEATAWAGELHLAAVARRTGRAREELTLDGRSSDGELCATLEPAKAAIRFGRRDDPEWRRPSGHPHLRRGIGYALAPTAPAPGAAVSATASFAGASSFLVAVTSAETRAGLHVGLARVAAEVLGVRSEQITVLGGDTDRVPPGEVGFGAGFAVSAGAVKQAADELRARLQARAARRLGVAARSIELVDGAAVAADGRSIELEELAESPGEAPAEPLVGSGIGRAGAGRRGEGAVSAAVEVDTRTGVVTVLHLVTVVAAGTVVDPDGAALHQGARAAAAASEALGRCLGTDLVPHTSVLLTSVGDEGPFGARSLGSVPDRAVTPALHAAILDAVGVDLDVFPFTAERVATALAGLERADR